MNPAYGLVVLSEPSDAALDILTDLGHPNADRVRATLQAANRGHNG